MTGLWWDWRFLQGSSATRSRDDTWIRMSDLHDACEEHRSGGVMLVSATHWIELTNVNADEAQVAQVLLQQQGQLAADNFNADNFNAQLKSCKSPEERSAFSSRSAVALVQCSPASAPLKSKSKS